MENTIVEYIRKSHGRKKGLLVAGAVDGKMFIGYSLCADEDKFDNKMALRMAMTRAFVLDTGRGADKVPTTVRTAVRAFAKRCVRYYKEVALPGWVADEVEAAAQRAAAKEA